MNEKINQTFDHLCIAIQNNAGPPLSENITVDLHDITDPHSEKMAQPYKN